MNQMLSIEPSQIQTLAKNKAVAQQIQAELEESAPGSEKADFLTMMLAQLSSKEGTEEGETAIDLKILETLTTQTTGLEDIEDLTIERATFSQLLQLIEALSGDEEATKFPVFTEKLDALLKDEAVLTEFKNAKSLQDLVKLGEKYDLGLQKLTISTEEMEKLEKTFPKLAEKEFFQPKKDILSSESILKTKQPQSSTVMVKEEKPASLQDLIKSLDDIKETKAEVKADIKETKAEVKADIKETKAEVKADIKETKAEVKADLTETSKIVTDKSDQKNAEIIKNDVPKENMAVKQKTDVTDTISHSTVKIKDDKKAVKISAQPIEKEVKTETPKTLVTEPQKESKLSQSSVFEQTLQTIKPQKINEPTLQQTKEAITTKTIETLNDNEMAQQERGSDTENSHENKQSSLTREIGKQPTVQAKQTIVKQAMSHFAQDFKEQVENYKPPMMKVQMALNPNNLGDVEVTLVNRGNSLHVNFTSNTQTMNIFLQNQAEFKNSLVNMGFTNLEMNFSDQRQQQNQQNKSKFAQQFLGDEAEEFNNEMASLEMVIPNYV